jgi:trans-2-enoyl-CoA reductase
MSFRQGVLFNSRSSRYFSSRRAVVYSTTGDPTHVLSVSRVTSLPDPVSTNHVGVKFLLSPINPADLNIVQGTVTICNLKRLMQLSSFFTGVYPSKPEIRHDLGTPSPSFIGGNEGVGQVERVGSGVNNLSIGDWVIITRPQSGTWASHAYVNAKDVILVDKRVGEARAATITASPLSYTIDNCVI